MATKIARPDTAFPLSGGQKRPRARRGDHLAFLRGLPCLKCGRWGSEAAHIRYGSLRHGKRDTGIGEKPSDCWAVPLCAGDHRLNSDAQHNSGERAWWHDIVIDPLVVAALLFAVSGDEEAGRLIIANWRPT